MKYALRSALWLLGCWVGLSVAAAPAVGDSLFVRLNSGAIDAFVAADIASRTEEGGELRLQLQDGPLVTYRLSEVAEVVDEWSVGAMPSFTSFKFNNKYNHQVFTDVIATITDEGVTAEVGAIGKWLTPSFQVDQPDAVVYVGDVQQRSKLSRLDFARPVVYTLSRPGLHIWKKVKTKDEVWNVTEDKYTPSPIALTPSMFSTNAAPRDGEGFAEMLDGDTETLFHSTWGVDVSELPAQPYIQVDLAEDIAYMNFSYTTRNSGEGKCPKVFNVLVSSNGADWTSVARLADGLPNGRSQTYTSPNIDLKGSYRHVRFVQEENYYTKPYLCLAEFSMNALTFTPGSGGDEPAEPAEYEYRYMPWGREVPVTVTWLTDRATTVPRVDITTATGTPPADKVNYIDATIHIDGAGVWPDFDGDVTIRGRGNSSWLGSPYAKNPYRLKFAEAQKPFGLTKGKSWVLLANNQSGSMLTNALAMKAANLMGTAAANAIIPIELYMNGEYWGSYNFTQQVGFSNNSVDIDETNAVLFEIDSYFDEDIKFHDTYFNLPVNVKEPDLSGLSYTAQQTEQKRIQGEFDAFSSLVQEGGEAYADMLDIPHYASYISLNEFVMNQELMHPKSAYLYREDRTALHSKYVFGPAWDFDWGFGYEEDNAYCMSDPTREYYSAMSAAWGRPGAGFYDALSHGSERVKRARYAVWTRFMEQSQKEFFDYIDDYYAFAAPSLAHNATARGDKYDYAEVAQTMKAWLAQRAEAAYGQLEAYDLSTPQPIEVGDVNGDGVITIADAVCVVNELLGLPNEAFTFSQADADKSGAVTINDLVHIVAMVMQTDPEALATLSAPRAAAALQPQTFNAAARSAASVPLTLRVDEGEYAALQFDLSLPAGVTPADLCELAGEAQSKATLREQAEGKYRVALYRTDGKPFAAGSHALTLSLDVAQPLPEAQRVVSFSSILLSSKQGEENRLTACSARFDQAEATGIHTAAGDDAELVLSVAGGKVLTLEAAAAGQITIYTLDGRTAAKATLQAGINRIALPAGVYLVAGSKVVIL